MATAGESVVYEFGPFRLDAAERVLSRGGAPIALAPKVTETLVLLVNRAGHVVTKDELMATLWPDTFVDESNLAQNVFRLRRVLGGDGDEIYIETVPRRGYRFIHPVRLVSSGPEQPAAPPRRTFPFRVVFATLAALAVLITAARVGVSHAEREPAERVPLPLLEKLTTDSRAWDPAISPDGRLVAYAVLEGESKSMWLKNLGGGSPVRLMPPTPHDYHSLRFSPDGKEIFYKTHHPGIPNGVIEHVPLFGGVPQEVAQNVWGDFALSPDGRQVVFVRGSARPDENMLLVIKDVTGAGERVVARNTPPKSWFATWGSPPSWSPDGQHIVICGSVHRASGGREVIFEVRVRDGTVSELQTPAWQSIDQAAWLGDGSALVVVVREGASKPSQIWILDRRTGAARRITNDLNEYQKLSITLDGKQLVVEQRSSATHLWVMPEGDATRAKQLTFGATDNDGQFGLSWTPDGRILFTSKRTGEFEIWSMNPDGSDVRQLTAGSTAPNQSPRATADGRYVVFTSDRSRQSQIWRIDADGGNPIQLTRGGPHIQPDVSPDGRWVFSTAAAVTQATVERVPIDGGTPQRVAVGFRPAISPDGLTLAYHYSDDRGSHPALVATGGGQSRILDFSAERDVARWSPDGRGLIYMHFGTVNNLWLQPIDGGAPHPLTQSKQEHIWNFAVSPDGKSYALARGSPGNDIVLLSRFR